MRDRSPRLPTSAAGVGAALGLLFGLMSDQFLVAVIVGLIVGGLAGAIGERARSHLTCRRGPVAR